MKRIKIVRYDPQVIVDRDGEEYLWSKPVYRRTLWGWMCRLGREVLYKTSNLERTSR